MPDSTDGANLPDQLGGEVADFVLEIVGAGIPGAGLVAQPLFRKVREEWTRHRSTALRAAVSTSGLTLNDLRERITEDPRLIPLVTRLLYAAGMNGHDRTLKAMGAAFGRATREPDAMAECELILTAIADLTGDHARTLQLLTTEPPEFSGTALVWTPELLQRRSALSSRTTMLCLAALVARGLVDSTSGFGGVTVCRVTSLGYEVLQVLREYADDA